FHRSLVGFHLGVDAEWATRFVRGMIVRTADDGASGIEGPEEHADAGAEAGPAADADGAVMIANDAEDGGEAKAAAGKLGGEEGLEDAAAHAAAHADAAILDLKQYAPPRRCVALDAPVRV